MQPEAIALDFELDPRVTRFRGAARYSIVLERRCRQLELHAVDLHVSRVRVTLDDSRCAGRVEAHPECETILLKFDRLLPQGRIVLELAFRGRIRDDLRGIYRSTDRRAPWLASQLCPTDARRVFPCFDEPGIKSRYRIRATVPADQTVISNAPVERERSGPNGTKRVAFEATPPLSAYLVALVVGPFEVSRPVRAGHTPIRVLTLPGQASLGRFARDAAVASLSRLERWFGIAHPYPKLDLVALPDFAFGAMENAGAVFFRDSLLLLDEKKATSEDKMRAAETIAHELSHMWFGNLVTMAWWNDLWLNESFATWMAYEIVEDWRPEWRMWIEFIHRRESALELDALASSHPIAPPVRTADEANENFDAITYTKGASVLRMLERFVGARAFREGVRRYLRKHAESSATAADLWDALGRVSGLSIERIVAPWTLETGHPIVATRLRRDGHGDTRIQLAQSRWLSLPGGTPRTERWSIPWIGRVGRGKRSREVRHLLERRRDACAAPGKAPDWLYANAAEAGFFRIDLGRDGFAALLSAIAALSPIERVGWTGHQWALVRSGRAPIDTLLDLVSALADDPDPDLLRAMERVLTEISRRLTPSLDGVGRSRWAEWIRARFEPQFATLGWRGGRDESEASARRRGRLVSLLGGLAKSRSIEEACAEATAVHLAKNRALPVGAEAEVLRIAAHSGDATLHDALVRAAREAATPQARRRYLLALAGFEEASLRRRTLAACDDASLAPAVDRVTLLMALLGRPETAVATWRHLERSWARLERTLPPILLARLAGETASALPPTSAREVRSFFETHPLVAGARVLRQIDETFAIARRLEKLARADLSAYLARNS